MRRVLMASLAFASLTIATHAHADAAADAKDLFERARQLRSAGNCVGAAPLFHKAYDIFPTALGPIRNAAECEESAGRWASARRSWLELKRALLLTKDSKYAGWEADVDAATERLASRVAHLVIDVSTSGHAADALEVTVNGEPLLRELVGTELDRDPGKYVVVAHIGTGAPAEQTIELTTGESRSLKLVVAPPGQPLPKQPKQDVTSTSSWTPAGVVTLSLGIAALAAGSIFVGVRQDALAALDQQCPPNSDGAYVNCSPNLKPTVNRGNLASTAATVFFVGGGIVSAAGIVMLVLGAVEPTHASRTVAFHVSPFGVMLEGSFR